MFGLLPFIMAVAPALLLLRYYYRQDKQRPEPKGLVFKIFLLGILSTVPAILLELFLDSFRRFLSPSTVLYALFKAFVVAALCEEGIKLLVVRRFAYRNAAFDEVMDGVVYMVVASLGFACMENILYVMGGGVGGAVVRAFTAVPLHALASGTMGYFVGEARFASSRGEERALTLRGLFWAVLIHGLYDFLLFTIPSLGPLPTLGLIPLMVGSFLALRAKIRAALAEDKRSGRSGPGGLEQTGNADETLP